MTFKAAKEKAADTSRKFAGPTFVCLGNKGYFVISEDRYNLKGLDSRVMAIYENGAELQSR